MKTALFVNFTDHEFTGYWNGKGRTYPAGASEFMPDYLAQHFAKHLVNRELLRVDANGNLIHKNGDKMTSPKKPEEAPIFMDLFKKAYFSEDGDDLGSVDDGLDSLIGAANKNRAERIAKAEASKTSIKSAPPLSKPRQAKPQESADYKKEKGSDLSGEPKIVLPPDWNDGDDEASTDENKS